MHLKGTCDAIEKFPNVNIFIYNIRNTIPTLFRGRDKFLDRITEEYRVDAVMTVFGPSRWRPRVPHLSGFAQGHIVQPESPYWNLIPFLKRIRIKWHLIWVKYSLGKSADNYFTENPLITERLQKLFPHKRMMTVTNNANQIFQKPEMWDNNISIPLFDGITLLTVCANYPHKNLPIIIPTCKYLEERHPNFRFRFVLTVREEDLKGLDERARRHIVFLGPVKIDQVPHLYEQADIMLLPTLLECFSASYAEAMVMKKPILTTNLEFARGVCGQSALYYDATSPEALGEGIVRLATSRELCSQLVENGTNQLALFDTYEQRAEKLIQTVESLAKEFK
jgi:glycosyltransferase involved in cell wall biosynthesis